MKRRSEYLGHILRMDKDRTLKRFLLELSPGKAPFSEGSLLGETSFQTIAEMIEAAADREYWRGLTPNEQLDAGESHTSLGIAASR